MIAFTLKLESGKSIYMQIYSHISHEIVGGRLKKGEKLPSKRSLAQHLHISLNTVDSAYQMLCAEGYIQSVPKSGFYVCEIELLAVAAQKAESKEIQKEGEGAPEYDFATNTVDASLFPFKTWARLSREVMAYGDLLLNHGDRQGDIALRRSIAEYLHSFRGVQCSAEQIVVGAGIEYLLLILAQLLGKGTVWGIENPGYAKTYRILQNIGVETRLISLDERGARPDLLEAEGCSTAYITPSHQFPTGLTMPIGRRAELLRWASAVDGRYIIEDDYDSEFRFDGKPIPALQGLAGGERVVYLSTFSKSLAPSIRIGYMVLPAALLDKYKRVCSVYSSTVSRFEQHTLERFLQGGHFARHINRVRNEYKTRKNILVSALKNTFSSSEIEIRHENTGLHLPVSFYIGMTERELISSASAHGIRLVGMSAFDLSGAGGGDTQIIFGYSAMDKGRIVQAVEVLKRAACKSDR